MPRNRDHNDRTLTLGGVHVDMGYLDSLEEQQGASSRIMEDREGDGDDGIETDIDTSSSSSSSSLLLSTESADIQEDHNADIGSGGDQVGSTTASVHHHHHRPPSPLALAEEMYSSFNSSTYSSISIDSSIISDSGSGSSTVELMDVYNELEDHGAHTTPTTSLSSPPPVCRQHYCDDDEEHNWEEDRKGGGGGGWTQKMFSDDGLLSLILPHSDHFSLLVNTIAVSCASTAILFTYALFFPCE